MSKSNPSIGLAIAGFGSRLRGLMRNILHHDEGGIRLVGIHDPFAGSIQSAREIFGDFTVYDTYQKLVEDPAVDWVAIGSWNSMHAEQILAAREYGKHIFCEKPLATSLEDCRRIHRAIEGYDKHFSFGLVLRYSPFYRKVKELLEQGVVGNFLSMEFNETLNFNHGGYIMGNWRRLREHSGPHVLEKCCHDFDIANWLTQSVPVTAASFGGKRFFIPENALREAEIGPNYEGKPAFGTWADPCRINPFTGGGDVTDAQVAILQYQNGVYASFHTNTVAAIPERRFYIVGDRGTLRADVLTGTIEYAPMEHDPVHTTLRLSAAGGHGGGDRVLTDDLRETMLRNTTPKAGIREAIQSAIPCIAVDEAQRTGKVIDLTSWWEMG